MDDKIRTACEKLVNKSRDCIVAALDEGGAPVMKCMFRRENEGLTTFWFSTNTSAEQTALWQANPLASVYFVDHRFFHGLLLKGEMKVHLDDETRRRFWKPTDVMYYPKGVTDPDYCILEFTAKSGRYYHNLSKLSFSAEELC